MAASGWVRGYPLSLNNNVRPKRRWRWRVPILQVAIIVLLATVMGLLVHGCLSGLSAATECEERGGVLVDTWSGDHVCVRPMELP